MATIKKIEELEAWKQARALVQEVYLLTAKGNFSKDFNLRDQIRRAGISVMANIAEGFDRDGTGEFIQFLSIAKGSAGEVKCHLYIARDQNYLNQEQFDHLFSLTDKVGNIIGGLMSYLKRAGIKGNKFKSPKLETPNSKCET